MRTEPSESIRTILRSRQNWAGRILELAEHLAPGDRALISMIYYHGMTASEFARAAGTHRRSVAMRIRRLVDRITSDTYQRVVAIHKTWPPQRQAVAEAIFLQGMTQREAAKRLDISLHRVRRECDHIRAVVEAAEPRMNTDEHE